MNEKPVVAARAAHHVLENVHEAFCDELRVLQGKQSHRAQTDSVRRLSKCVKAMKQVLTHQNGNFAKIRGAGASSYVMNTMEVERKRKAREENNGKRLSAYEETIKWIEDASDTDIADIVTPRRIRTPGQESALKICRTVSDDTYVQELMDLDPKVKRTPEEFVRMLAQAPELRKTSVAQSWSENGLIPMQPRGIMKYITHLANGNTMSAFKASRCGTQHQ